MPPWILLLGCTRTTAFHATMDSAAWLHKGNSFPCHHGFCYLAAQGQQLSMSPWKLLPGCIRTTAFHATMDTTALLHKDTAAFHATMDTAACLHKDKSFPCHYGFCCLAAQGQQLSMPPWILLPGCIRTTAFHATIDTAA